MNAMKRTTARTILASLALAAVSVSALAHGGHGAEGTHLHVPCRSGANSGRGADPAQTLQ